MALHLTESAAQELRRLVATSPGAQGVRFWVEAGGCAGLTYKLELVSEPSAEEKRVEIEGIPFYIRESQRILWEGIEIDYPTGLAARGFVFRNPQARSTCGCGTSFAV